MTKMKKGPMYQVGDLVMLARFGQIPEREEHRVFGIILESLDSDSSHFHVPRYRVRLIGGKLNDTAPFGSRFEQDAKVATVLEYDLLPANRGESQEN